MNIKPLYRKISLDLIDLEDQTFRLAPVATDNPTNALRESISGFGVIHPPLLVEKEDSRFALLAGRHRLMAVRELPGQDYCSCLVLPPSTPPADALAFALEEILLNRPATPLEQAICWRQAVRFLGEEGAAARFGPKLELTRQYPPAILAQIADLDSTMQGALHEGRLELKTVLRLIELEPADRAKVFEIISLLNLSSANQKKIIDLGRELGRRREQGIATLLAEPACLEILDHPGANPPQKTALLMNWLTTLCNPGLAAAEEEFRHFIGRLHLPKGVQVRHAPSFEKDALQVTIEFRDHQQLTVEWPLLSKIITEMNSRPE